VLRQREGCDIVRIEVGIMVDLEFYFSAAKGKSEIDIGLWLEENMPNPPLPDEQRWTIGEANDGTGRSGIRFFNDIDATLFSLRWGR